MRYKDLITFFLVHARPALNQSDPLSEVAVDKTEQKKDAAQFAQKLEELGPTYVKFGQLLSTRKDLLPDTYVDALQRLQDGVEEIPFEQVADTFKEELDVSVTQAFAEFNEKPIASASLGQTHLAKTREGVEVVVKVQRPGIRRRIVEDLDTLESVAAFLDKHSEAGETYHFGDLLSQFKRNILEELDYRHEANNLLSLSNGLKSSKRLMVPSPHLSFSSERVLTMDYVAGSKITDISGFSMMNIDGEELVDELICSYLNQFIVDGFFHADPHPGNLLLTKEGKIAFIDLGMVGRLNASMRDGVFHLFSGICENKSERVVDVLLNLGHQENFAVDRQRLLEDITELVSRSQNVSVKELQFGTVVMRILELCSKNGVILPKEFSMIGKALLNIDQICIKLAPNFNPSQRVQAHLKVITMQRSISSLSPSDLFAAGIQFKDLIQRAPQRLDNLLDNLAENKFRINADVIDEKELIRGFQKIANRITMGLIVGALLLASTQMMDIESSFTLFGYPGFAITLMILALGLGIVTVYGVLKNDS